MRATLAAYCAGVLAGTFSLQLLLTGFMALLCAALLLFVARQWLADGTGKAVRLVAVFLLGLGHHALWAHAALGAQLPDALQGRDLVLEGVVADIPVRALPATRLLLSVTAGPPQLLGQYVQLSDYEAREFRAGQRWRLTARLRSPHGLANPGGRDREAWFLQQGIVAVGYVRGADTALLGTQSGLAALRGWLLERLLEALDRGPVSDRDFNFSSNSNSNSNSNPNPDSAAVAVLPALLLGVDSGIDAELRDLFARTGTSHLFVISGLHIGMIAASVYFLLNKALRRITWFSTRIAVQRLAGIGSLLAALLYAVLSGFELPAQRALIMIAVFIGGNLCARAINVWLRYWLALAVVLTLMPLAPLSAGFWFSFVAVAVLLLTLPTFNSAPLLVNMLKPQIAIFIGMLVPMAVWMGQVSLLAPLINLVAIPLLGLLVVPVAFLALGIALLNEPLASLVFIVPETLLEWFIVALRKSVSAAPVLGNISELQLALPSLLGIICVALASLLLLLPLPWSWRTLALPLLLPLLWRPDGERAVIAEELLLRVFDVGQGLSVLISVGDRHLLYDTGAGQPGGFSVAAAEVIPALRSLGIRPEHELIVSHWDNDHAGGVEALRETFPELRLLSNRRPDNRPGAFRIGDGLCVAGQQWQWGGARFRFLHPDEGSVGQDSLLGNDNSCVLQLRYGEQGVLIPGDISRRVEHELVLRYGESLRSSVLIAPHHGSRTSSSYPLLKFVAPDWVVFSAGANNSFGHPAVPVVARYAAQGAGLLSTANSGMLTFALDGRSAAPRVRRYRVDSPRYWRRSQNDYWCRYYDQVCDTAL